MSLPGRAVILSNRILRLGIVYFLMAGLSLLIYYSPGMIKVPFHDSDETALVIGDRLINQEEVVLEKDEILLPLPTVKQHLDKHIFWDKEKNKVIVTTRDKFIRMKTASLTAYINSQEVKLDVPVSQISGLIYIPIRFLAPLYGITVKYLPETKIVVIDRADEEIIQGIAVKRTRVRTGRSVRKPFVDYLQAGEKVLIFGSEDGWFRIRTLRGITGYVKKNNIRVEDRVSVELPPKETPLNEIPPGKINLTWEHVINKHPDPSTIGQLPGVNVVSPTWFYLADGEGNVSNKGDLNYVNWAHRRGYQVWALFSNAFDPERTHKVLADSDLREKVIKQLLIYSRLYQLDGINIDFENVYLKDKALLVQFVRELSALLHAEGLTVSIDVTVKSSSANYSRVYDRRLLAEAVDYVILMGYDEHWAGSPEAGSVASLPWVEKGIVGVLEEVPAEKLILGVPFYTRLWVEKLGEEGILEVSSKALSMTEAEAIIRRNRAKVVFDEAAGQHYATFRQGDTIYEIWLENEISMRQRVQLVKKYGLAGIASWRRGFEKPVIWEIINEELNE
ncbi:glycosyl hydrolase family 18 protein [Calderihabitans maritimus]|uniref:Glycosyl hydrolase n=1 Tax=Calderihabitans maritimus TaxID=1246530 RepID=A0A1Z5HQI1_9FIRM|nr:glycosyl hydrolase family 18 protein [Calderihabitans maritimus]GAW91793.1 glycosyl hydrolase [Calderihabitans maritimus]